MSSKVEKLKADNDVSGLIDILVNGDDIEKSSAAEALGELGDKRAVETLILALRYADIVVRTQACLALGKLKDTRAVEPLISSLKDQMYTVRRTASEVLSRLGESKWTKIVRGDEEDWFRMAETKDPHFMDIAVPSCCNCGKPVELRGMRFSLSKFPFPLCRLCIDITQIQFFIDVRMPLGNAVCADKDCPCSGSAIPRGTGYLYISWDVFNFRKGIRSLLKLENMLATMKTLGAVSGKESYCPILLCEQAAKKRKLDLKVAARDAKLAWEKGTVPLRATPTI